MHQPFTIDHIPNRTIEHAGQTYLFFSGTSYLGIPQHPQMQTLLAEGMARYGLHFGSSRNGNLQLNIYEEAERKLAAKVGAAAALTTSSGMVAGQVLVDWFTRWVTPETLLLQAEGTHPALWHPLLKPQMVAPGWEAIAPLLSNPHQPVVYLTDSVNALRGLAHDFGWASRVKNPLTLIVDDSHGLGLLNGGQGIYPELCRLVEHQRPNVRFIVTASLAKAMGLPGGVILSDATVNEHIRHTAYFGACSPMPPAYAYAYVHAGTLYAEARERLARNVTLAEELLLPTGLFEAHSPGFPVFYTEHNDLYKRLLKQGIFIYSFAYPTPNHKTNTRIIISAYHEEDDIRKLAAALT